MMSLRCAQTLLLVALCLALVNIPKAEANRKYYYYPKEEPKCKFTPDFSTVENSLRSYIFLAKTEEAARLMNSDEMFSIGAGLRYRDNETCLMTQSSYRAKDPDIVAIQALAINSQNSGDTLKLARSIVLSFELECKCSLHTTVEKEQLTKNFKAILDNPEDRKEILEFGRHEPPQTHQYVYSSPYGSASHSGRRLSITESSPTNSKVCAHCDPPGTCRKSGVHWCQ